MSEKIINYQYGVFILKIVDSLVYCQICARGQPLAKGSYKIPPCFLMLPLHLLYKYLSTFSALLFFMVIGFIFNHFNFKYIERY